MPTVRLGRLAMSVSANTAGTDGLNAMLQIPGVSHTEIVQESESEVVISYSWDDMTPPFDDIDSHLSQFGLYKIQ